MVTVKTAAIPRVSLCARTGTLERVTSARFKPAASLMTSAMAASLPGAMMCTPATPGMVGKLTHQVDAELAAFGDRIGGGFEARDDRIRE